MGIKSRVTDWFFHAFNSFLLFKPFEWFLSSSSCCFSASTWDILTVLLFRMCVWRMCNWKIRIASIAYEKRRSLCVTSRSYHLRLSRVTYFMWSALRNRERFEVKLVCGWCAASDKSTMINGLELINSTWSMCAQQWLGTNAAANEGDACSTQPLQEKWSAFSVGQWQ